MSFLYNRNNRTSKSSIHVLLNSHVCVLDIIFRLRADFFSVIFKINYCYRVQTAKKFETSFQWKYFATAPTITEMTDFFLTVLVLFNLS